LFAGVFCSSLIALAVGSAGRPPREAMCRE
jgi:hypothetical protein